MRMCPVPWHRGRHWGQDKPHEKCGVSLIGCTRSWRYEETGSLSYGCVMSSVIAYIVACRQPALNIVKGDLLWVACICAHYNLYSLLLKEGLSS